MYLRRIYPVDITPKNPGVFLVYDSRINAWRKTNWDTQESYWSKRCEELENCLKDAVTQMQEAGWHKVNYETALNLLNTTEYT